MATGTGYAGLLPHLVLLRSEQMYSRQVLARTSKLLSCLHVGEFSAVRDPTGVTHETPPMEKLAVVYERPLKLT